MFQVQDVCFARRNALVDWAACFSCDRIGMKSPDYPIYVALLDDHAVVRMGYAREITSDARMELAGSYGSSLDLLQALRGGQRIDVLMLDYALSDTDSDGVQLISLLRQRYASIRILVASAHDNPATISLVLRAGADGFLSKAQAMRELLPAVREVALGRRYVPAHLAELLPHIPLAGRKRVSEGADAEAEHAGNGPFDVLSKREQEVMRCILDGLSVADIAVKYSRSTKTISNQKLAAFRKLGIRTLVEVAAYRDHYLNR